MTPGVESGDQGCPASLYQSCRVCVWVELRPQALELTSGLGPGLGWPHLTSCLALTWVPGKSCCTWPPSTPRVRNYSETPSCSQAPHWVSKQNLWKQISGGSLGHIWQLPTTTVHGPSAGSGVPDALHSRCTRSLDGHCLWDASRKDLPGNSWTQCFSSGSIQTKWSWISAPRPVPLLQAQAHSSAIMQ